MSIMTFNDLFCCSFSIGKIYYCLRDNHIPSSFNKRFGDFHPNKNYFVGIVYTKLPINVPYYQSFLACKRPRSKSKRSLHLQYVLFRVYCIATQHC